MRVAVSYISKVNNRKDAFLFVLHYVRHKYFIAFLGVINVCLSIISAITPKLYNILVDDALLQFNARLLCAICCSYIGLYILESILLFINLYFSNKTFYPIGVKLKRKVLMNLFGMNYSDFIKYNSGDLKNILSSDIQICENFVINSIISYFSEYLKIILYASAMIFINFKLSACAFLMIPLTFFSTKIISSKHENISKRVREKQGEYDGFVNRTLQNWTDIKTNNAFSYVCGKFSDFWNDMGKLYMKKQMLWVTNRTINAFKDFFITKIAIYIIAALFIYRGELTVGNFLSYIIYYENIFNSLSTISDKIVKFGEEKVSIQNVVDIVNEKKSSCKITHKMLEGDIVFNNISFSYEKSKYVLKDINFIIPHNMKTAIIGKSGSGKTTLIKLLLRMYTADGGMIFINNIPIEQIAVKQLHKIIGVVMQEPYFFSTSIRNNLLLAKSNASNSEIVEACKKADILDYINSLEEGFDTIIGENGAKISGGQKQRLAIARVFLRDPNIIIFDEATSALDSVTEENIKNIVNKTNKTLIIISHRESTISVAEKKVFLSKGTIVDKYN